MEKKDENICLCLRKIVYLRKYSFEIGQNNKMKNNTFWFWFIAYISKLFLLNGLNLLLK